MLAQVQSAKDRVVAAAAGGDEVLQAAILGGTQAAVQVQGPGAVAPRASGVSRPPPAAGADARRARVSARPTPRPWAWDATPPRRTSACGRCVGRSYRVQ